MRGRLWVQEFMSPHPGLKKCQFRSKTVTITDLAKDHVSQKITKQKGDEARGWALGQPPGSRFLSEVSRAGSRSSGTK